MGDFNSDPVNVHPILTSSRPCPIKHKIIHHLMTKNFIDIATLFSSNPSHTWSNGNQTSRIDQIWISPSLALTPISFNALNITSFFNADHKLLLSSLDLSTLVLHPTTHSIKTNMYSRKIFNYTATTPEKWENFTNQIDLMIEESQINTLFKQPPSLNNINSIWQELSSIIITTAKNILPTKKVSPQTTPHRPLAHTPLFRHHRKITHLLSSLHSFKQLPPSPSKWYITYSSIQSVTYSHNFTLPNFLPFSSTNLNIIINATKNFEQSLRQICLLEERKFINKQITENIKKRCNNLKDSPAKMLSSVLEKSHRRIDLNKILITLDDGSQYLSSDPDTVKEHTRLHFSKISSSSHDPPEQLWGEWSHYYQPLNHIKSSWFNSILSPITRIELTNTISDLPSKKATGPSLISNEMLKHLSSLTLEKLLLLFNRCLSISHIPTAWKQATIYPIPKPQEWNYQLTYTRPITLLECTRKCFYKIITKRLSAIILKHPILKGNNFAGLPGKSCQEPIHIINAVIEHARESKKECWILSQDMSKAFDLINREMLDRAMVRLHFPNQLRQILLTAFQNRTNQVITEHGLTEPYTLNNGVDQGEVFSPLMWCIYYDPLLSYIQSKPEIGYTISATLPSNLTTYPYTFNTESTTIADVAFMDDTTWIASSKEAMDKILSIASSFYQLNSIKVNPDKSSLLVLNPSTPQCETFATFNNTSINPASPNTPVRILGVWFNSSGSRKHHISSFKNTIKYFISLLYPKKLTGEQMIYIFNHVLAPKLEYRYQTTFFSKKECSNLLSPITKLLKNKLGLSHSFPNSVLHHPHFYNLFNYWHLQCQSMVTNFLIRVNDSSLIGKVSHIQLKQLQHTLWIPFCPLLLTEVFPTKLNHKNITAACITSMISSNMSCQFSSPLFISSYNIKGGNIPLINLIPDEYPKIASSLRKYSLLFLEQLLTINCSSFLPFNFLFHRLPFVKLRRPPKWYNLLKSNLCHPQKNCINPISNIPNINPFIFLPLYKPPSDMRKKPIIASIISSELIIVKRSSSTLYRHYKLNNNNTNTISPCEGCQRSIYSTNAPCTIKNLSNQILLATKRLPSSSSTYQLKIDKTDIIYLIQHTNNTQLIPIDNHIISNTPALTNNQLIQSILTTSPLQNILSSYAIKNQSSKFLTFYTDGSLSQFGQQNIKLSCAWIQIKNTNIEHSFSCSLKSFPSSTKAELMAIMTALLTCPQNCLVSIYTDSQSSIQLLENKTQYLNTRKKFKIKNFSIISSIQHIIDTLSLKITLHKIKAHSGNGFNDLADNLAKSASAEILAINPSSIKLHSTISFNQQIVDHPLRSFIKIISHSQTINKWRTQPILAKIIPPNTSINWTYTEFCLSLSNYSMFTERNSHFYHGSLLSFKYEILHNTLPTIKILTRNYPTLLPPNLNCLYCNQYPENITHLFTCHVNPSTSLIPWSTIQQIVTLSISNWYSPSQQTKILQRLQPLLLSNFNNISPITLAVGIIPYSLSDSIHSILKSHKKSSLILHYISYNLITFYYKEIWLPRCSLFNSWLRQNNINLKNKTSNQTYPSITVTQQNSTRNSIPLNYPTNSHLTLINNFIETGSNFLLPR